MGRPAGAATVVDLGGADQLRFEAFDLLTEPRDDGQVGGEHRAGAGVGEDVEVESGAVGGVGELLRRRGEVVLQERHLQVSQEFGAFADEVGAAAQEVTGGPHRLRIDVGLGERAAAEQAGQLPGVDGVGLGLAAVDRLEVQRVAQDEGDALGGAQVGEPVPGEQALAADDQAVAERRQHLQEPVLLRR